MFTATATATSRVCLHNILCGMNPDGKVFHGQVNALTNKRDEDPRNEVSTLNLLLKYAIAVGSYGR